MTKIMSRAQLDQETAVIGGRLRNKARPARVDKWREYERRKAEFLRDANAKPGDYEQFIRRLGEKLGL